MIKKEDYYVKDEEDLRDLNRRVISLGEKFDKPVVATCDNLLILRMRYTEGLSWQEKALMRC